MEIEYKPLNWSSRICLIAGSAASVVWAITFYWSPIATSTLLGFYSPVGSRIAAVTNYPHIFEQ